MEKKAGVYFRIIHRYLGFYLVGIMAVYSVSGITLIFRRTDTFKKGSPLRSEKNAESPQSNNPESNLLAKYFFWSVFDVFRSFIFLDVPPKYYCL